MILPAYMAKLAANGQATTALVPVKQPREVKRPTARVLRHADEPRLKRTGESGTYWTRPWEPVSGHHEPLRAATTKTAAKVADIIIGSHVRMLLAALLDDTPAMISLARSAGFKTRSALAREWMRHYDRRQDWPPLKLANCPACEGTGIIDPDGVAAGVTDLVECPDCDMGAIYLEDTPTDDEILARFKARHGATLVYVVEFAIDKTDHVRLLSPAGRPRGDELGYTENPAHALQDAGEAVPAAFQASLSKRAGERDAKLRQAQIEQGRRMIEQGLRMIETVGDESLRSPIDALRRRNERLSKRIDAA